MKFVKESECYDGDLVKDHLEIISADRTDRKILRKEEERLRK